MAGRRSALVKPEVNADLVGWDRDRAGMAGVRL